MKIKGMPISKIIRKVRKRIYLGSSDSVTIKHIDEVGINTNLSCNLKCVMCHQSEIKCNKDMKYDMFKKILVNLKKSGVTKISIVGGEIFVLKDAWRFIELMEKMKFNYDLSSNLFNVPDIERFARLKNLEMVTTSIDGLMETHNKIRGNSKAFQNTTRNIEKILKMGIQLDSACVVQRANIDELEEMVIYLCKLGVRSFTFMVANKITQNEKECAVRSIERISGAKAGFFVSSKDNPLGDFTDQDVKKFNVKILNLKKIVKKFGATASFSLQLLEPKLMSKDVSLANYTCSLFNGYSPYVHSDGNFNTCAFTKLLDGKFDLSKNDPFKILNSEEYLRIRRHFKKFGAMPKCRYCCALCRK